MNTGQALDQLEDRIRHLIAGLHRLQHDKQQLSKQLFDTRNAFKQQQQLLEGEREQYRQALKKAEKQHNPEAGRLQEQQIQLLEKERQNLRDQIVLLQNNTQNKESGWQVKLNEAQTQWEQQKKQYIQENNHLQEKLSLLEQQMKSDKETFEQQEQSFALYRSQQSETEQKFQAAYQLAQTKLTETEEQLNAITGSLKDLQEQNVRLTQELEQANADNASRQARFDAQLTELQEQLHLQSEQLAQEHNRELARMQQAQSIAMEQLEQERNVLLEQVQVLGDKNNHYRNLLQSSADSIRELLGRLPVEDDTE